MSHPSGEPQRIATITLDERTVIRRSRAIEDERAAAITDLLKGNQFTPLSGRAGPFHPAHRGCCLPAVAAASKGPAVDPHTRRCPACDPEGGRSDEDIAAMMMENPHRILEGCEPY